MKKYYYILFITGFSFSLFGQITTNEVSFTKFISEFKKFDSDWGLFKNQKFSEPYLYKDDDYAILISENPIYFEIDSLILKNPYYTDDFDDWNENYINFPKSFSVIYKDNLISLFDNGKFVCHNLNDISRNNELEKELNIKKFKYHWIIEGKLYAKSKSILFSGLYQWNGEKWVNSEIKIPVTDESILFSDDKFIVYRRCNGEFGGTIYFFDRDSKKTYFTESTCANTVIKKNEQYQILSHLGHMTGNSEIKIIDDPKKLTKAKASQLRKKLGNLGYQDKTNAYTIELDIKDVLVFSTFKNEDRNLFITNLNECTFLAEIKGKEIQIVNPLFNNDKYTHDPITNTYGKYTLINMDYYGTALDREVSLIIIKDNKITLIDWNENHNR